MAFQQVPHLLQNRPHLQIDYTHLNYQKETFCWEITYNKKLAPPDLFVETHQEAKRSALITLDEAITMTAAGTTA